MKKLFLLIVVCVVSMCAKAQIGDAFKGVWPVTDKAMMQSLNGEWQLKVVKGIDDNRTVPAVDHTWGTIPVPGCWEAYGFSEPTYNYPDSLTGYYRTAFTIPGEWKGQQVIIRLDGVLRGYDLWLNNQLVGTWESGYNTCLFDLTPYLTKRAFKGEPQQLALRVYSQFKGYEFDCFDDWAMMGISFEGHDRQWEIIERTPGIAGGSVWEWVDQGMPFGTSPDLPEGEENLRSGFWAKHQDDLYFEGNHGGVDAAFFSDKEGNGLLVVGDSLNLNFEQTDRGLVVTVNAAVSGQGPKFAKTAFKGWQLGDALVYGEFVIWRIEAGTLPQTVSRLFTPAAAVPAPFKPFLTQYDTYLLRYNDIKSTD
jgi:hypothetical protein